MPAKKSNKNAPHLREALATQRLSEEDLVKLLEKAAAEAEDGEDGDRDEKKPDAEDTANAAKK